MNKINDVKNLNSDGSASVYIYGEIGGDGVDGVNGALVAEQIKFLGEQGVSKINVHINSPGGLVSDGLSIFNAITNSEVEVNTYVDGIAASIAGIIAMAGKKRYMNDFGRIMIHMPSVPSASSVDQMNPSFREGIKQISEVIGKILVNNSRMSKDAIMGMMERETWLDPDVALSMGFIDEVITTERTEIKYVQNYIKEIYNSCMRDIQEDLILTNTNLTMKEVKNFLKLDTESTEEQVLSEVKNLSEKLNSVNSQLEGKTAEMTNVISEKDSEIENLKKDVQSLKEQLKQFTDKEVIAFVEDSIELGKLDGEKKDELVAEAVNNFDLFKKLVNSLPTVVAKSANIISKIENKQEEITNLRELEKTNPAKLKDLYENNKDEYARLYKLTYGVEFRK